MDVIRDLAIVILVSAVIIAVFYPYYSITFISREIEHLVQAVQELNQTIKDMMTQRPEGKGVPDEL